LRLTARSLATIGCWPSAQSKTRNRLLRESHPNHRLPVFLSLVGSLWLATTNGYTLRKGGMKSKTMAFIAETLSQLDRLTGVAWAEYYCHRKMEFFGQFQKGRVFDIQFGADFFSETLNYLSGKKHYVEDTVKAIRQRQNSQRGKFVRATMEFNDASPKKQSEIFDAGATRYEKDYLAFLQDNQT
jgi:hypothetical protein